MMLLDQLSRYKGKISTMHELRTTTDIIQSYQDSALYLPKYQKYQWGNIQKTRFIESILLRIPMPPIFVEEFLEKEYEEINSLVIDGTQRICTILEFSQTLKTLANSEKLIKLEGAEILTELNGLSWSDFENNNLLNRAFRNCTLLFCVIENKSDIYIADYYCTIKKGLI